MSTEKKIIMYDSPDAATRKTVTGWVSANGHFWGNDEHMARYDGSTHKRCDCGAIIANSDYCRACQNQKEIEKYRKAERKPWDGVCMLYSETYDKWFSNSKAVEEFLEDANCDLQSDDQLTERDLRLYLSEPNYAHYAQIDSEHFCDLLYEDDDLPGEIEDAIRVFNEALCAYKEPLSWHVSNVAAMLPLVESMKADEPKGQITP